MNVRDFENKRHIIDTSAGRIATYSFGEGPTALFIHGFPLTSFAWRKQMAGLSDLRRCVGIDLLGLGYTEAAPGTAIHYDRQAEMISEVVEALSLGPVDLVGNDSGGSISQLFATAHPEQIRTLTLTNCEVKDNNPPEALVPLVEIARSGQLGGILAAMMADVNAARAGLAQVFENPEAVLDEERLRYAIGPIVGTDERRRQAAEYITSLSPETTVRAAEALARFERPILVAWGSADEYMDVKWAHWLEENIPAVERKVILDGAKLFFPEERSAELNDALRSFWNSHPA